MLGSYTGKILWIDLTEESVTAKDLDEGLARKYIGGAGLAAKLLWDETTAATDPLSPENLLVFMLGPTTGTPIPYSSFYTVAGISPLTDIWGEAHAGGFWGYQLKWAGFDGIVLKGKAKRQVYLWIHDGEAEIADATHIWGKDAYETSDILRQETEEKASIAAIGPAGEKLVRFACIMNDGKAGRAAARCGMGAVMGSKNLKAIAVRGTIRPKIKNREKLRRSLDKYFPMVIIDEEASKEAAREYERTMLKVGRQGFKNFTGHEGDLEGWPLKSIEFLLTDELYHCWGCRYSCVESHLSNGERHVGIQCCGSLGSQSMVEDFEAINQAYRLCNRYGMDCESTGSVIAFAMECFEKGLVTRVDTEGLDLNWGNGQALVAMVRKIGERQGFGEVLGEGVKKAAEHIGGLAPEYAMHTKGLEFEGAHDPRISNAFALEQATSSMGGHHIEASFLSLLYYGTALPDIGIFEPQNTPERRFATRQQGELVAKLQNFSVVIDCLVLCKIGIQYPRSQQFIGASRLVEWLNYVTGWNMDLVEFLKIGERVFNLKRLFNVRRGISRKDDSLPPRLLTRKRGGQSESAENLPPLGAMLNEYYAYRGWSEEGIPTREKLAELQLEELLDVLQ